MIEYMINSEHWTAYAMWLTLIVPLGLTGGVFIFWPIWKLVNLYFKKLDAKMEDDEDEDER